MKRLLLQLLCPLLFVACGDDGGGDTPIGGSEYLNVAESIEITGEQTSATLAVNASPGCRWTVTPTGFITNVSPASGTGSQTVSITVSQNPSSSASRTATIKVSHVSGVIEDRFCVLTQSPSAEFLELSVATLNFASSPDNREVTVSSNTHWTVTGGGSWLSLDKTAGDNNGTVRITADANSSKDEREIVLTFTGTNGTTKQLTVRQAAADYTNISAPQVSDITQTGATVAFSFDSSSTVTSYGVCYATTDNPTVENAQQQSQASSAKQGSPTLKLTELASGTTYYVRAYVINALGTYYSSSATFKTPANWPGGDDNQTPNL